MTLIRFSRDDTAQLEQYKSQERGREGKAEREGERGDRGERDT